jgi:two-component system chemotaxis response regulator CheY
MNLDLTTRVLVAEDNPNLRKVIINIVRKIGFTDIVEAEDGLVAWQKIEEGGVGLVLTDWSMPGITGLDLLKKVRASAPPISKLPFLMITAADTKDSILSAGKEGVDAYIIKPFSVKTIVDKIEEAVANRAGK